MDLSTNQLWEATVLILLLWKKACLCGALINLIKEGVVAGPGFNFVLRETATDEKHKFNILRQNSYSSES